MLLTSHTSRRLASRFGLLGLLAVVLALPYALPPLGEWVTGSKPGLTVYLTKPVENQHFFLLLSVFPLAVLFFLWRSLAPPRRLPRASVAALALVFLGCQFLSVFQAPSPGASLRMFLLPAACAAGFLVLIGAETDRRSIEKLMFMALVAAIPAAAYAIAQSQGWEFLPYHRISAAEDLVAEDTAAKQRTSSTFGHPNYMASYLAPLVFWSLYFLLKGGARLRRAVGAVGFALLITAMVLAGTRGAWLAVAVSAVPFYLALAMAPAYRRQLLFAGGLAVVAAVLLLFIPNPLLRVQFDLKERLFASKEIVTRFYYWTVAGRMLQENPLGVGYGAFDVLYFDYAAALQQSEQGREYEFLLRDNLRASRPVFVHNDHLQIVTEGGIVTGAAWIALWAAFLAQAGEVIRFGRRSAGVALLGATFLASAMTMAIDALTGFPFHIPVSSFYFWLLLAGWASWYGTRPHGRAEA